MSRVDALAAISRLVVLIACGSPELIGTAAEVPPLATASADDNVAQRDFFERQVRPLLVEHCFECHSGESKKLQAGLRLDSRVQMLAGGESGPAIIPGDAANSLLMAAVRYESFEMPPSRKLAASEVEILAQWIRDGAWWPTEFAARVNAPAKFDWPARKAVHWAWQPPQPRTPPQVADGSWPHNGVDQFILAKLEANGLAPAADAHPDQRVRRLFFDLIGLPPTALDAERFAADPSPAAYAELVDRLLDSAQFGEKWARHWMDLVRYAETCGHEFDFPLAHATQYRDYLIRAFNADIPYDQLVREHLAGDLLTHPRRHPIEGYNESILGTGYWFLGEAVHAPTDVRGDESDRIDNQIDVFGKTFLGITLACARCHDHKFDPIPTADYYAIAGFLQSSRRQEAMLDPHDRIAEAAAQLAQRQTSVQVALRDWAKSAPPPTRESWPALSSAEVTTSATAPPAAARGGVATSESDPVTSHWQAALADPAVQHVRHPAFALQLLQADDDATFQVRRSELQAMCRQAAEEHRRSSAALVTFADFRQQGFSDWFLTGAAFGNRPTVSGDLERWSTTAQLARPGLAHSGRLGRRFQGVLRSPTFTLEHQQIHYRMAGDGARIRLIVDGYVMDLFSALLFADATLEAVNTGDEFRWVTQREDLTHYLGHRAHLEIIDQGDGYAALEQICFSNEGPPTDAPSILMQAILDAPESDSKAGMATAYRALVEQAWRAWQTGDLTAEQTDLLNWLLRWQLCVPPAEIGESLSLGAERANQVPIPLLALAMTDGSAEDERIHIRGKHTNLGPTAPRRMLVAIAGEAQPAIEHGSGRLYLAEQLVGPDNPLVSRVIVNRLWHHLLGRGLVASVDDFGVMGSRPTHPELLDWLALDLRDHQWSLKHVIRQIVLSRTYQLSSEPADPAAAERDPTNQLWHRALIRRLPAEAIRDAMLAVSGRLDTTQFGPSVPVYLTPFMTGRGRPEGGPLDGAGRRSIYIRTQRNFLSPMMLTFDAPSPFSTMGRRSRSNVPAQSLILMNDELVWQQAEIWAARLLQDFHDPQERLRQACLAVWAHPPTSTQLDRLTTFIAEQAAEFGQPADSLAVWTDVCHSLWNTKSFLFVF